MGGLVGHELAGEGGGPVLVPIDGQRPRPVRRELALVPAAEVLGLGVHVQVPRELLVVLRPVARLLGLAAGLVALDPPIDDVDGGSEPGVDAVPPVGAVGDPGAVDHVEHARLGGLGGDIEPRGRGKVEPRVRHKVRMIQQKTTLSEHGLAELTVIEVVTELLGASAKILLPVSVSIFATGPFLCEAVGFHAVIIVVTSLKTINRTFP